jgi:hypothetical protein
MLTRRLGEVTSTEETKETGSNAHLTARLSRTAYEWPRVGLRVNDKAGGAKRSIALE